MMDKQVNHKIAQALERISKTFRVLLWKESKKYGISPIQIQILIFCLNHKEELLKVSLLASEFDLTKATISDSIRILLKKELLIKVPDVNDSRSYTLRLTNRGREIASKTSNYTEDLEASIDVLVNSDEKGIFLNNLLDIIDKLSKKSVISIQRMCLTCNHYEKKGKTHYCAFLEKHLENDQLQIDCQEHKLPSV